MGKTYKDQVMNAVFHEKIDNLSEKSKTKFDRMYHKSTNGGTKFSGRTTTIMYDSNSDYDIGFRFGNKRKSIAKDKVLARRSDRAKNNKIIID